MAVSTILKAVKQAAWVGWKVETNWADPLVFAIYYLIRPVASLLTVGFMFMIGSRSSVSGVLDPKLFTFMFIGNSFFIYVVQIMMTMTMLIHDDRSHYEVLKHIYLSPGSLSWYIVGRALNGVMNATISLLLTLGFGVVIFQNLLGVQVSINWAGIDYSLLAISLVLGIICFMAMGFILCGINIMTSRVQFMLNEYVSGILYLFGEVVFVPEVLPSWGQAITKALPITYFLNNMRFSILHQGSTDVQTSLLYLILTMVATIIIGVGVFRIAMYKARRDGLIDKKEEY
jgi:ABC-2 type transport system permease protein